MLDMLFVSSLSNRNWILGNWIKELNSRIQIESRIKWVPTSFSEKNYPQFIENLISPKLPEARTYFFTFPTLFYHYLKRQPEYVKWRSIILYTHRVPLLGDIQEQVEILNQCLTVHFACSQDAEVLRLAGLNPQKIRLALGAIDDELFNIQTEDKFSKPSVLLCSRFSERKGLGILPELVQALPHLNFVVLGRDWKSFLDSNGLAEEPNFFFHELNFNSRNLIMPKCHYFLSLSELEGGPIPLMESMFFNLIPVATDTGFARDLIKDRSNGILLKLKPKVSDVVKAFSLANSLTEQPHNSVYRYTWSRLSDMTLQDHLSN